MIKEVFPHRYILFSDFPRKINCFEILIQIKKKKKKGGTISEAFECIMNFGVMYADVNTRFLSLSKNARLYG